MNTYDLIIRKMYFNVFWYKIKVLPFLVQNIKT